MTLFDLPQAAAAEADVLVLPLPFEGTTSYGKGTAAGPAAIVEASAHVELWDEELDSDLDELRFHTAEAVVPRNGEPPETYLKRVADAAASLHEYGGLVIGFGGEHSLTPPLVQAAAGREDLAGLTVVQFDAHSDLRDTWHGTPHSHACAMRRVVERGAHVLAIGIRSAERDEFEYGTASGRVRTFFAQQFADEPQAEAELLDALANLKGDVYLTIDIDCLEVALCPGTGTPQPGGLGWWQTLRYLRRLLVENRTLRLIGCDIVETTPQTGTRVNEFVAARLLAKVIGYWRTGAAPGTGFDVG
ncbi:MAG: agmatinase [Planctomycetes bacterium]|nr:agmatinase [Planctomycetota bacterium]